MLNLEAPIVPGFGAAGLGIGTRITQVIEQVQPENHVELEGCSRDDFGPVRVWSRSGVIDQIGVSQGYTGSLDGVIRIGSSIDDVERHFGSPVVEGDEDNLVVSGTTGWCFETEQWGGNHTVNENRDRRITWIFVFHESV